MYMYYTSKKSLVTVDRAEEDGELYTIDSMLLFKKGDLISHDQYGNPSVLTEEDFYENYLAVKKLRKTRTPRKSPFETAYAKGYFEMGQSVKQSNDNGENYIFDLKK